MEDGYISVGGGEQNISPKSKKNKIIKSILLCLGIFVLICVVVVVCVFVDDAKTKKFESYFGGYDTAQEYVNTLVSVNDLYLLESPYYNNSYGVGISISNLSDKTVASVKIKYTAYNSMGYHIDSDFDDKTFSYPFGVQGGYYRDSARIYDSSAPIYKIKITYLKIVYEDGSTIKFNTGMLDCLKKGLVL